MRIDKFVAVALGHKSLSSELKLNASTSAGLAITNSNTTDDGISTTMERQCLDIFINTATTICVFMSTQLSGCVSTALAVVGWDDD